MCVQDDLINPYLEVKYKIVILIPMFMMNQLLSKKIYLWHDLHNTYFEHLQIKDNSS